MHIDTAEIKNYILTFVKWICFATLLGGICGIIGVIFHHSIEIATEYRLHHSWSLFLAPFLGILITFLYKKSAMLSDKGTNAVFEAVRHGDHIKGRLFPLIFVGTTLTHLAGGSSGREGAALQMGASISSTIARWFKLNTAQVKIIITCGMSAMFSALFQTPITATIFCIEVVNVGAFQYATLFPALLSAIVAYGVSLILGATPMFFTITSFGGYVQIDILIKVLFLSVLCGIVSIVLCETMHIATDLYKKYFPNPYVRIAVGGLGIMLFTVLEPTGDYNGAGMNLASRALEGEPIALWAFILKLVLTAITLGAGFKGGEIVPTLCIGATFGSVVGSALGLPLDFASAIGLVSVFCGATNGPLASLFLGIEFFGSGNLIYMALACAVSFMLSGKYSLYSSQKMVYSKLEPVALETPSIN